MRRQEGFALLLALATAAFATLLVSRLLIRADAGLTRTEDAFQRAQGWQILRGGVDWARLLLEEDGWRTAIDHRGEPWAAPIPPTAADGGELSGAIEDLDGRFDINGISGDADREALARLLALLRLPATLARPIAAAAPLADIEALATIPEITPDVFARLRPHLAALPERRPLNANTATAEVLAARGNLSLARARELVHERDLARYRDMADLRSRIDGAWLKENAGVSSRYFIAHIDVRIEGTVLAGEALIERPVGQTSRIVWQRVS